MQKKLLAASFLLLIGAGCTSTASIDTNVDTTTDDAASGTQETGTEEQNDTDTTTEGGIDVTGTVTTNEGTTTLELDATASTQLFTVTGTNFAFAPSAMTVKKGDTVVITFKNGDGFHDFVIDELNVRTAQIQDGAQETVTFVADKAGTFEYYCSVGQHRAMGMKGTLTVTE